MVIIGTFWPQAIRKYSIPIAQIIEFDKWLENIINHQIVWDYKTQNKTQSFF